MDRRAEGLNRLFTASAPTCVGLFCVLLVSLPMRPFGGHLPMPALPLIVVYFWTIRAPDQLPSPSVFALGLLQDFLSGGPLGLWSATYLCVQYIVLTQRSYFAGRALQVLWTGFAVAAAVSFLIVWLTTSLLVGAELNATRLLNPLPLLGRMFATVAVYPVFAAFFALLHQRFFRVA